VGHLETEEVRLNEVVPEFVCVMEYVRLGEEVTVLVCVRERVRDGEIVGVKVAEGQKEELMVKVGVVVAEGHKEGLMVKLAETQFETLTVYVGEPEKQEVGETVEKGVKELVILGVYVAEPLQQV